MNQDYDEIGIWSEVKLDIIREYAVAYSTILSKQRLRHIYVDAFGVLAFTSRGIPANGWRVVR
jgi:hypothetical protein